jgi:hypothetical protein
MATPLQSIGGRGSQPDTLRCSKCQYSSGQAGPVRPAGSCQRQRHTSRVQTITGTSHDASFTPENLQHRHQSGLQFQVLEILYSALISQRQNFHTSNVGAACCRRSPVATGPLAELVRRLPAVGPWRRPRPLRTPTGPGVPAQARASRTWLRGAEGLGVCSDLLELSESPYIRARAVPALICRVEQTADQCRVTADGNGPTAMVSAICRWPWFRPIAEFGQGELQLPPTASRNRHLAQLSSYTPIASRVPLLHLANST